MPASNEEAVIQKDDAVLSTRIPVNALKKEPCTDPSSSVETQTDALNRKLCSQELMLSLLPGCSTPLICLTVYPSERQFMCMKVKCCTWV